MTDGVLVTVDGRSEGVHCQSGLSACDHCGLLAHDMAGEDNDDCNGD